MSASEPLGLQLLALPPVNRTYVGGEFHGACQMMEWSSGRRGISHAMIVLYVCR